jgi:phospholipid/cholesterol/gamma-HCH transport system substrate-binding protein
VSPYRRNILVGVVVLGALIFLGWMILKFGDQPAKLFAEPTMPVTFIAARADGVAEGSPVLYQGVNVGRVKSVRRSDNGLDVTIEAQVDLKPPLPANVEGRIIAQSLLGAGAGINLYLTGPKPEGELAANAKLEAKYIGLALLPAEFEALASELRTTTIQFRESKIIEHLDLQVQKAGQVMDSVKTLVDDKEMRENLRQSLANVKEATATANRIGTNLERVSGEFEKLTADARGTVKTAQTTIEHADAQVTDIGKQVNQRMTQVAKLLDTFQSISQKIDTGQGTAGQLVNDPRLYQSLVSTSQELNATITDLKRLVEQWEQEGMTFKLGKK